MLMLLSDSALHRHKALQRMAWLCAVMVLAITSLSAYIRLSKVGLGCQPWPACYAQTLEQPEASAPAQSASVALARMAHRVIASASLVVVLALWAIAWRWRLPLQARMAAQLCIVAMVLAVLGRWSAQSQLWAVTLGNILGGFMMLALSVRLACTAAPELAPPERGLMPTQARTVAHVARWCAVWVLVQTVLGTLPSHISDSPLHMVHRVSGFILVLALWMLAKHAWHNRRRDVTLVLALLSLGSAASGFVSVALQLPLAGVWGHNLCAALLLATLWTIQGDRKIE